MAIKIPRVEPDPAKPEKESKQKKPRRFAVKDASFFLYKRLEPNGHLSPLGSFETLPDILKAYGKALDEGIPQE